MFSGRLQTLYLLIGREHMVYLGDHFPSSWRKTLPQQTPRFEMVLGFCINIRAVLEVAQSQWRNPH